MSEAQRAVRKYLERWGIRVVDGGVRDTYGESYDLVKDLRSAGVFVAGFYPLAGERYLTCECRSAVDVPRRTVYWPAEADDAFMLLHEAAHLIVALLTGDPVDCHDEDAVVREFEYYSVEYLARHHDVSLSDWWLWRQSTSCDDREVPLEHLREVMGARRVVDGYLFHPTASGFDPTHWLPVGDLKPDEE